jgi:hypothetical protein
VKILKWRGHYSETPDTWFQSIFCHISNITVCIYADLYLKALIFVCWVFLTNACIEHINKLLILKLIKIDICMLGIYEDLYLSQSKSVGLSMVFTDLWEPLGERTNLWSVSRHAHLGSWLCNFWCFFSFFFFFNPIRLFFWPCHAMMLIRKMIDLQQHHNKCTTPSHMGVEPSVWSPPPCEGVLCTCCGGVVYESNLC